MLGYTEIGDVHSVQLSVEMKLVEITHRYGTLRPLRRGTSSLITP